MERHVAHSALVRVLSGHASAPEVEAVVPHLVRCRECWEQAARVGAELKRDGALPAPAADARGAILILIEKEEGQALRRLLACGRWAELEQFPARRQLDRITADPALRTLEMFSTLTAEAESASRHDPHLGAETALVAHSLAGALSGDRYPESFRNDLQAEALGIAGNCRRLAADWRGSAAALGAARDHLRQGTGEPSRAARLLSLQASLASDTGRLEQALELLARATALYREAIENDGIAAISVQEASTLLAGCRHEEAIARAEEALRWLTPSEARLALLARNIVTESLVFLGRSAEALQSFLATQPLYQQLRGRRTELQSSYYEALLLDALGYARDSEKAFRTTIAGFFEAELYKDAFLVTLTEFECLVRRGALDKAAWVCEEAIERIEQAGAACHSQMTELWRGLLALVVARSLTEHQVLAARQYLVRHWHAPARQAPLEQPGGRSSFPVRYRDPSRLDTRPSTRPTLRRSADEGPTFAPEIQSEHPSTSRAEPAADLAQESYEEALERFDRELIAAGLARGGGRVRETARQLGISRNTLRTKLRKYGLAAGEDRVDPGPAGGDREVEAVAWLRARAWWRELKTLPSGEQLERLRTVSSLQTREMLDTLLAEASTVALDEPRRAEETALLAHALAGLLPRSRCPVPVRNDLQAAALLIAANSRRRTGDWQGASAALGTARAHLAHGSGEPARAAQVLSVEASLASDMGEGEKALVLLARAAALCRRAQDVSSVGSVAVQEASVLLAADRHEQAVARAEEALRSLPLGEVRLELLARSIVTESLVFLGRPAEALRSLVGVQPLYERLRGTRTELQRRYLEALVLDALGHELEAEKLYRSTVARLIEAELYKDAFLILLTQFLSLVRRGALDRAALVCEEALAGIEEAERPGRSRVTELWRALLTVHARRLAESHPLETRQVLARCWNAPTPSARQGRGADPETGGTPLPAWMTGTATEAPSPPARPPAAEPPDPVPQASDGGLAPLAPPDAAASLAEVGYKRALARYDRQLVAAALARGQGRIAETSRLLGISRNSLRAKLKRYFLTGAED